MSRKLFRLVVTGVGLLSKLRKHGEPILSGDHSGEPPVESRMGASTDAKRRPVSHPRSSNRTCGFPASGFPTGFTVDSRTRPQLYLTELENSQLAEDNVVRKPPGAARRHLVTPPQEMPYAIRNVMIDRPICLRPSPVAEVCRPASQNLIQPILHLRPRPRIAWLQQVSHFFLDTCHRLPGRACSQIPMAILLVAMRSERVTQKVEALFARLLDTGFRLIQGDPHPVYHLPRPIQCLSRFAATENHKIIRVVDDWGIILLTYGKTKYERYVDEHGTVRKRIRHLPIIQRYSSNFHEPGGSMKPYPSTWTDQRPPHRCSLRKLAYAL